MRKVLRNTPDYMWKLPLLALLINNLIYFGSKLLAAGWVHHELNIPLDERIPLVPWTVSIYFGCYVFWAVNYILCARQSRRLAYRFFCADMIAKLTCFAFFLILPTMIQRPSIQGDGFWDAGMRFLYYKDTPVNLFPSIHCLASWLCYIGVRSNKDIPAWYRHASWIMALAVFISTLTTKQHFIVDVFAGVAVAEISWWLAGQSSVLYAYARFVHHLVLNRKRVMPRDKGLYKQ